MKKSYIYIAVTLITSYIIGWLLFRGTNPLENPVSTIIYSMLPAIVALILSKLNGYKLKDLYFRKAPLKFLIISAIIPIIYGGVMVVISLLISNATFKESFNLLTTLPVLILGAVISIPIYLGEEIGWRGYLQKNLVNSLGVDKGIIVLGFVWGIWHLPVALLNYNSLDNPIFEAFIFYPLYCIFMSYVFFYLTEKYKSIWPAVIIHSFNNNVAAATLVVGVNIENKLLHAFTLLAVVLVTGLIFRRKYFKTIDQNIEKTDTI